MNQNDFDIEAKREQWKKEREELQQQDIHRYLAFAKFWLFPVTVYVLLCFNTMLFSDGLLLGNIRSSIFYGVWFGTIGSLLFYSVRYDRVLDKFCIAILIFAIASIGFSIYGYGYLLTEDSAKKFVILSKLSAVGGVISTMYPINYFWTHREQLKKENNDNDKNINNEIFY